MKYICNICGFIYDEDVSKIKWKDLNSDWLCPICKATKEAFVLENSKVAPIKKSLYKDNNEDITSLELSVICSNLAKGCEKQYLFEEMALYQQLAELYKQKTVLPKEDNLEDLLSLISNDLNDNYPYSHQVAKEINDRGAKRVLVWSEKVTHMQDSLIKRFIHDDGASLKDTNIYVCDICGFIYTGKQPPEICPVCKVPSFKILEIERS